MIIEFEGRAWDVDPAKINVDEWREFKRKYKMTPAQFETGITEADPDASTFLYWIMLRRSGQQMVSLGDHLKPDILALNEAVARAQETGQAPAPEPEPPVPPTSRPGSEASPVPGSPTTTTPPAAAPSALTLNGSGQVTSNGSMPSTSAPSPPSATSTSQMSASSP